MEGKSRSIEEKLSDVYAMAKEVHSEFVSKNANRSLPLNRDIVNVTKYYGEAFKENALETEGQFKKFLLSKYE